MAVPDSSWEGKEPQSPGRRSQKRDGLEAVTSAKRRDFRRVRVGVTRKKGLLLQMSCDYLGSLHQLKLQKKIGSSEIWLRRSLPRVESRWQNIPGGGEEIPRFGISWIGEVQMVARALGSSLGLLLPPGADRIVGIL